VNTTQIQVEHLPLKFSQHDLSVTTPGTKLKKANLSLCNSPTFEKIGFKSPSKPAKNG
jgi:hypothetical protein